MLTLTRRPIQQLAGEFRELKSRTQKADGSARDLNKAPGQSHLQDIKDVSRELQDVDDMFMISDSKGDFSKGTYSKTDTMRWNGELTMKKSTSFQERPDGMVETLEQIDAEGDGRVDYLTRQVFDPTQQEGFNIAQ